MDLPQNRSKQQDQERHTEHGEDYLRHGIEIT